MSRSFPCAGTAARDILARRAGGAVNLEFSIEIAAQPLYAVVE